MPSWPTIAALLFTLTVSASSGLAQEKSAAESRGARGILIRNPDRTTGQPPFAVADQYGKVRRLVEPTPGINLASHVGEKVRIKHDTGRTLLASQLVLPSGSEGREPEPLRQVSPAQFIAPGRGVRTADRRAPDPRDRRFVVIPAQGLDDAASDFGDFADDLPGPAVADDAASSAPIQLDDLPAPSVRDRLDPIPNGGPNGGYYEEIPPAQPIHPGHGHAGHDPNCPHCNKSPPPAIDHGPDCPHCQAKQAPPVNLCNTCGRSEGWCGPSCNPASRRGLYGRLDYMLWWFNEMETPPLATRNLDGNAPILGTPGTQVIYGGELADGPRDGLRITLGAWLDDCRNFGIEADWSEFETETDTFAYSDLGARFAVGRPFYNLTPSADGTGAQLQPPAEDVQIISFPELAAGDLSIIARSKFRTGGLRLRTGLCCCDLGGCQTGCGDVCGCGPPRNSGISRVDFLVGYRHASLEEQLTFFEYSERFSANGDSLGEIELSEAFQVDNDFHGLDLGFVYEWRRRRLGLELLSRVAIGGTSQRVAVTGANTVSFGDALAVTTPGGLYTQSSNLGNYERERFSILPELSARLSYAVTPRFSVSAGYTLLYWANVVRPGDQIDPSIDTRLIGGGATPTVSSHPQFNFKETSLWAHGLNLGVDYRY